MKYQIKTPAERTAGAACDVVDTRSDIASSNLNSTNPAQQKAPARKQLEAEAKFSEILFTRGLSVEAEATQLAGSTTARSAWLASQFYRVKKFLRFKGHRHG